MMSVLADSADLVVLCLSDEVELVKNSFFGRGHLKSPFENVASCLMMSAVPFPQLKFFTTAKALGQELETGDIMTTAVTVGSETCKSLEEEKFVAAQNKWSSLVLSDTNFKAMTQRLILTDGSREDCTLISPAKVLMKLMTFLEEKAQAQGVPMEQYCCLSDLKMTYDAYLGCANPPGEPV